MEVEVSPNEWRSVNNYDDKEAAIKDADGRPNARVRQFKTTVFTEDKVTKEVEETKPTSNLVPIVSFFCPSHPENVARAFATSNPKCSQCHKEMFKGSGTSKGKTI